MDHIPYTGSSTISVPYIEGDDFDGEDFLGYPGRWNIRHRPSVVDLDSESAVTLVLPEEHNFLTLDPVILARCLQQWLFVGFYSTVLKLARVDFAVADVKDYDGRPADDPRLCTKALPKYFQAFRRAVFDELTTAEHDSLEDQLNSIFHYVTKNLSMHCSQLYSQPRDDPDIAEQIQYVAFPITLSIQHCLSALFTVCHDTFRHLPGRGPPKFGALRCGVAHIEDEFNQLMIKVGWCPSVVSKTVTWNTNGDFRYAVFTHWWEIMHRNRKDARIERLMQLFGKKSKPTDHSLCNGKTCKLSQVDENDYQVRHLDHECYCWNVYASPGAVELVLQSGGIPVCRLVPKDSEGLQSWKLEVQEASSHRLYTAISHVWSQGLGNPNENTLPECQLIRIQGLVNMTSKHISTGSWDESAYHVTPETSKANHWFWMDTLCVPVQPNAKELRKQAIKRMRQTYQDAQSTLVIDTTFMQTPLAVDECLDATDPSVFLVFAQILSSPWSGRLWTLQESVLAKRVYTVFGGDETHLSILDLDDVFRLLQGTAAPQVSSRGSLVSNQACNFMKTLRKPYAAATATATAPPDLESILGALVHRSTSRRSDEALCIASLLGLDVGPLLDVVATSSVDDDDDDALADARMVRLLRCMRAVPSNVLFSPGGAPRLALPGFTWAPRSFLGFGFSTQCMAQGVLTAAGLELALDGIVLADERETVLAGDVALGAGDRVVRTGAPVDGLLLVREVGSLAASEVRTVLRRRGGKALVLGVENRAEMTSAAVWVTLSSEHPAESRLHADFGGTSQVVDECWSGRRAAGTFDVRRFVDRRGVSIPVGFFVKGIEWCIR